MNRKIYFGSKTLFLTDSKKDTDSFKWDIIEYFKDASDILKIINQLDSNIKINSICVYYHDVNFVLSLIESQFSLIEAAGGIIKNSTNQLLFIFRNGVWDLPKGKREAGESVLETALREVKEETGLMSVISGDLIGNTYHTYFVGEKRILKKTYWFSMYCNQNHLRPQSEEGISEARWIDADNLKMVYENTYGSIKDILGKL